MSLVAHYIKLIDFTFGGRRSRSGSGLRRDRRGQANGPTWDSNQLKLVYEYEDGREAAFDIHTPWVNPDNFPGYVEEEVQFRVDNGVWNGHLCRRGIECTIGGKDPERVQDHDQHPLQRHVRRRAPLWGERSQRGYGIEALEHFFREVAFVEFGGPAQDRDDRLATMRELVRTTICRPTARSSPRYKPWSTSCGNTSPATRTVSCR